MVKTNVTLCSLPLDNPIIPASGKKTFGKAEERGGADTAA